MEYSFSVYIQNKLRVDMYLSTLFKDFSRSYVQKMIDDGSLKINNNVTIKNIKVNNRDEIKLNVSTTPLKGVYPEEMDLDIIFEDANILIVNKSTNLNVHPVPGSEGKKSTLVNGILHHCNESLPIINGIERPGIVHRLDKDTSGLIMVAKNDKMMSYLSGIIKERKVGKYYIAVVSGILKKDKFTIESYIGRDPKNRKKMTTKTPNNPKLSITHGKVLDYIDNKYSLLMLKLETGRTHQIRVHLASIGYPIIGDKVYGNPKVNKEVFTIYGLKRQALHAYFLELELYKKNFKFVASLKNDMQKLINFHIEAKY